MTVLFVSSVSDLTGGAERSLLDLARALHRRGVQVTLACWREEELTRAFSDIGRAFVLGAGDPASPLGGATTGIRFLRPIVRLANHVRLALRPVGREARWIAEVARETGAEVLHTNCDLSPPAVDRAARDAGVPWVAHVRDDWRAWFHPRIAGALRTADAVIAPSDFLASRFRQHGIDPVRIPNPVDGRELRRELSRAERARIREEVADVSPSVRATSAPFLVAVVGRLDEQKGTLRIVETATRFTEFGETRIRFLLAGAGSGPTESRLRRAINAGDLGDRIKILGHRQDVARWLPAMDALAVPSTGEPFGRMIVEGMHAGLPIVAFSDGAAPEIVDPDRTGVLVPAGDVAALAVALQALADDPARARRLGEAARSAAARYEPGAIARDVEALYQRITGGRDAEV